MVSWPIVLVVCFLLAGIEPRGPSLAAPAGHVAPPADDPVPVSGQAVAQPEGAPQSRSLPQKPCCGSNVALGP